MKIGQRQTEAFVRKPDPTIRAILVYGPNRGLVRERFDQLTLSIVNETSDPFRVAQLTGRQIISDPACLFDEAAALSLTGGDRVVRVQEAAENITDVLRRFLENPPGEALILVEGGELGPRSSLRRLFESESAAAALACYPDNGPALEHLIEGLLSAHNVTAARDVQALIATLIGSDRAIVRQELEKLALYAGSGAKVTTRDVLAVIGDNTELSLQEVALATADGDFAALERALEKVRQEGFPPVAVLRVCGTHFLRLHQAAGAVTSGASPKAAVARLKPPVFWQIEPQFRRQLGRWRPETLGIALRWLIQGEIDAKTTGRPSQTICHRTLTRIAAVGARAAHS